MSVVQRHPNVPVSHPGLADRTLNHFQHLLIPLFRFDHFLLRRDGTRLMEGN